MKPSNTFGLIFNLMHAPLGRKSIGKKIKNKRLLLDYHSFKECVIEDCVIIYLGIGPIKINGGMIKNCTYEVDGPAGRTLSWLRCMEYLAPDIILKTFGEIIMKSIITKGSNHGK